MVILTTFDKLEIDGKVELEIGFGNGEFLKRLAESNKNINYVGVEVSWQSVKRASKKLKKFENVYLVWGDVWPFLMFSAEDLKFQRVFSLFPDPWPKRRHIHKRIFSVDFWKLLSLRVAENVQVTIVSDHYPSLSWYYDNAITTGCWWGYISESVRSFGTKYERKWVNMGKSIYEAVFFLKGRCNFTIPKCDMRIPKLERINLKKIEGEFKLPDGSHLSIKECFISDEFMLLKAIISEEKLIHKVWFEIRRDGGLWKIVPSEFSRFYPTKALQYALDFLANELTR